MDILGYLYWISIGNLRVIPWHILKISILIHSKPNFCILRYPLVTFSFSLKYPIDIHAYPFKTNICILDYPKIYPFISNELTFSIHRYPTGNSIRFSAVLAGCRSNLLISGVSNWFLIHRRQSPGQHSRFRGGRGRRRLRARRRRRRRRRRTSVASADIQKDNKSGY